MQSELIFNNKGNVAFFLFLFILAQSLLCGLPCLAFLKGNGGLSLIRLPLSLELAEGAFVVIDRHIIVFLIRCFG